MPIRLRSLRSLTIALLTLFVVATALSGFGIYSATHAAIARQIDKRIASQSRALIGNGPSDPAAIIRRIVEMERHRDTAGIGVRLVDGAGRTLAGNLQLAHPLPLGVSEVDPAEQIAGLSRGRALVRRVAPDMTLTLVERSEPVDHYDSTRIRIHLIGYGAIILVALVGLFMLGATISRRIVAMNRTVEAIIDGDMQHRVPVDGSGSEFDQQARAFNRMLDRIGALMEGISNVSNDIAHDLRTPLSRLRGQLSAMAPRLDALGMGDEIASAIAQNDEILAMFSAILRIADVEGGDRRAHFVTLDLAALAREIGAALEPMVDDSGHRLIVAADMPVAVRGDRRLLGQLLVNLVENAVHHTPANASIEIGVIRCDNEARLSVRDDGPGIPAGLHALALRRFGRLDKSRTGSGHGLGLPLVDAISRLHRGRLMLADARPGLDVIVTMPAV